jgi:hypothetical protein
MADTVFMSDLIEEAKDLADQQNASFVLTTELLRVLNRSAKRFQQLLLKNDPDAIPVLEHTIVGDGSSSYAVAANHMAIVGVYYEQGGGVRTKLRPFSVVERERLIGVESSQASCYRMNGQASIELRPAPTNGTYTVVYYAAPASIDATTDTIDGIGGFESLLMYDLALHMVAKESSRRVDIMQMREADKREVLSLFDNKKPVTTHSVTDVYGDHDYDEPSDFPKFGGA